MADHAPPEIQAQLIAAALNNPHQLFIVDRVLKIDVGAFVSNVTFGNSAPNGQFMAVTTITASTEKLLEFANTIIDEVKANSKDISKEHAEFAKKIK